MNKIQYRLSKAAFVALGLGHLVLSVVVAYRWGMEGTLVVTTAAILTAAMIWTDVHRRQARDLAQTKACEAEEGRAH
ncbi:hypothetical protein [Nonomuraea sp. NPDC050786]|uniref:hypothetical protein n=1 Tax=Nonomuraea sp. NPDC050786 TaxID=3154840 RepID=UPI0033E10BC9